MEKDGSIFISYAWGGPLEKKEWLRYQVVNSINSLPDYSLFWDRDSIPFGQSIDEAIGNALNSRPIVVLCICDEDYCEAAKRTDSGLRKEISRLESIAGMEGVRIIPVILDSGCKSKLPPLFQGRNHLDLSELHRKKLFLGNAIYGVVIGATPAKTVSLVETQIRLAELCERANAHFLGKTITLYGNATTHEVMNNNFQLLLPPKWMLESQDWSYLLSNDDMYFSPQKGIWPWNYGYKSRTICALGTAACASFFPDKLSDADIRALECCGRILAEKEFSMTKETEPFDLDAERLIQILLSAPEGETVVTQLLT